MNNVIASSVKTTALPRQVRYIRALNTRFERVAEAVAAQVAELLCAPVWVIDEQDEVVAGGMPGSVDLDYDPAYRADEPTYLRLPLRLDGQTGTVVIGSPLNGEVLSPRMAQVLIQLVASQVITLDRLPNRQERKNTFINDLLHGLITDDSVITRETSILGIDLTTPRAVILIDAADYILAPAWRGGEHNSVVVQRRAQLVIGSVVSFFHLPNDTICAYIGNGEIAVLKASNTKNLVTWADSRDISEGTSSAWANLAALKRAGEALLSHLQADTGAAISIGIGRYHPGMCGIARSYQDARAALSLGQHFRGQNRVHCLDSLGIAAFVGLADERTKIELATHLLSPLDHEPELLHTLATFFANDCCPSSTAGRLSIHRNTLGYRLQKIASLTGLDPRRFDEATQIHLALLLRSFHGTSAIGGTARGEAKGEGPPDQEPAGHNGSAPRKEAVLS